MYHNIILIIINKYEKTFDINRHYKGRNVELIDHTPSLIKKESLLKKYFNY